MNETSLKKQKLLYELIDKVEDFKKNDDSIKIDFYPEFTECIGDFEKQNEKVYKINFYIITRLFSEEYEKIKTERGKFTIDEYYDFIESLNLPDKIYELYIRMPQNIMNNKILSYITDIPSFMGIIKD